MATAPWRVKVPSIELNCSRPNVSWAARLQAQARRGLSRQTARENPRPERDHIRPRERQDRRGWPGYWIYHNRDDSISFGTEQRDYFGWLPAEITRAVPESVINTIASMVCHAQRMGRKEAHGYLQQFVLEQMRVPDLPHYPMNDLRRMTPKKL